MARLLLLFLLSFATGFAAYAEEPQDVENKSYWLCKHNKEVRTIRVHIDEHKVCHTFYSKQGEEKSVGSGQNHESCQNFLNSIKSNLEKSNWNCRDITDTKITAVME